MPEIYYAADVTSDWAPLDVWAKSNEGNYMIFRSVLTEYAADSTTLTPAAGWTDLNNAVSGYQGSNVGNSTDITWAN
jgi:hypothetical protein